MQDLRVRGQHGATTVPPGELEPSQHIRKTKAGLAPGGQDNRRAHISLMRVSLMRG
jgi:hypothetical protein